MSSANLGHKNLKIWKSYRPNVPFSGTLRRKAFHPKQLRNSIRENVHQ